MDFTKLIEDEFIEFKREIPSGQKLASEVISFANTKGKSHKSKVY